MTWKARAEDASAGTSPEELIAAALSTCFSMALSGGLARAGTPPTSLETHVVSTFEGGVGITKFAVNARWYVPAFDEDAFREAAEQAKENCPVSKALKANVELDARRGARSSRSRCSRSSSGLSELALSSP